MLQSIQAYFAAHPEVLPLVLWPMLTALASLVQGAIRARYPRVAAFLSAAGLDLVALVASMRAKASAPALPGLDEPKPVEPGAK